MTVMGTLAPKPQEPLDRHDIIDRLTYWGAHLAEHKAGKSNVALTRNEISTQLNRYLDELYDLDPNTRYCRLPTDETQWACTWCGADISGSVPDATTENTATP